jgi:hypothetical protein
MAKRKVKLGWIARIAKRVIVPIIVKRLQGSKLRDRVVSLLNEKVDIPRMSEAEERRLLNSVFDALGAALVDVLSDD